MSRGVAPDDPTSFASQRPGRRMWVLLGGPLANLLFALGVLLALYSTGTHVVVPLTVGTITPGSEAARAQLLPGDRILSVDGEPLESWAAFVEQIAQSPGRERSLAIERQGEPRDVTVRPRPDERGEGRIGVSQQYVYRVYGPGQALLQALAHTANLVVEGTRVLERLRQGRPGLVTVNPLGVVKQTSGAASSGLGAFLRVLVSLSVALAFFHLLPLPSLDGGRLLFVLFEAVSRRKVPARLETLLHATGFVVLLGLVLLVPLTEVRQHLGAGPSSGEAELGESGSSPLFFWEHTRSPSGAPSSASSEPSPNACWPTGSPSGICREDAPPRAPPP